VRSELGGLAELPLGGALKLRAIGRFAAISDSTEVNHRTTVAGIVAVAATPAVELSGQFHQISYARPTTAGYFAPRLAQVAQAGSYIELETASSAVFACDLGVGVQRAADHGARFGPWRRAFSLYALVTAPLAPGRELRLELDIEDSPVAAESATTGQWRYDSAVLSLRWALP